MDRHAVALVLEEIATLLDARGEDRFRVRAFRTAARAVEKAEGDLAPLVAAGSLRELRGIGPATARVIEELVLTGESSYHADLRSQSPAGVRDLLRVPGLGPKKIALLHERLGIADLDALEDAARTGRITELRGFGPGTQQRILAGIEFARGAAGRRRYHHAEEAAARLAGFVGAVPGVAESVVAGGVRRGLEVVDGVTVAARVEGAVGSVAAALRATSGVTWTDAEPAAVRSGAIAGADEAVVVSGRLADGLRVAVHLATAPRFGAVLLAATGSEAHTGVLSGIAADRGLTLASDGLLEGDALLDTPDEAAVYAALDLPWIPPELRETGAEVEAARDGLLPRLVEAGDLRGCFHCHTTWSDGTATVQEMAEGALALGWNYLGIADHSRSAGYAGGLAARQLERQRREIAEWNRRRGAELLLFSGVEADILQDGQLDYAAQGEDAVLDSLDYVVASVHSRFRTERAAMTRRITGALEDPRLTMLGHATGRLLLTREGYPLDLDAVIERAAAVGAAIEINSDPHRLDLSWQHWPRARALGVRAVINPDAHSVAALHNVRYGVTMARKGWLTPADVVNTWSREDVIEYLAARKGNGEGR